MPVTTIDAYLAKQPPQQAKVLKQVRALIRKAAPETTEVISYSMPAVRVKEGLVVFFAAWKAHWSLYPVSAVLTPTLAKALSKYEQSKGTVRFPLNEPVPAKLVERIVKARLAEVSERAAARKKPSRRKS